MTGISQIIYPEFWKQIEVCLSLEPNGIENIKRVLTLLDYTTIQSVTKFSQKKQINILELEFTKYKLNNQEEMQQFPDLVKLQFGSGFTEILSDIATKIKKHFMRSDNAAVEDNVFMAIKNFCPEIQLMHVRVEFVVGEAKCTVQCPYPQCITKSTLSPYWTNTGPSFRVANFKRHYETHSVAEPKNQNRPNIQKITQENKPTGSNENMVRDGAGDFDRLKKYTQAMKLRSLVLSKTNMLLRSELNCIKKRKPLKPLENVISPKKANNTANFLADDQLEKENSALQSKLRIALCEIHRLNDERKKLLDINYDLRGRIRVFCRLRPIFESDIVADKIDYSVLANENLELVNATGRNEKFEFNKVFATDATQGQIFEMIMPMLQSAIDGYNICIFTHGQTGSGKTYTMNGGSGDNAGIIPRTIDHLFKAFDANRIFGWSYKLQLSCIEVYNENVFDLLGDGKTPKSIKLNEKNEASVANIIRAEVMSSTELNDLLGKAIKCRKTSKTLKNSSSSRSHFLVQLQLTSIHQNETTVSQINLVDLAGSESGDDSTNFAETKQINTSLLTLTKVMKALKNKDLHVSYRDSVLTRLLQPHLSGNSKVLMFVNISILKSCLSESLSSLRFATSVNQISLGTVSRNFAHKKN